MHCAEQGQAMRTPCDTTYIKDAQSPPPLTGRAAVLHVPNVMDLIPSIAARNMSLSLSTLSLSLRVRMKYRSVILVGKRKESNPLRDDGDNPSLSSPSLKSLGNGDRCESRGEEQDASCCVFIFHKRCAPHSQKKK